MPQVPVGVGAAWWREWDDYLAGEKVTERREYQLLAVDDTTATISVKATTSASSGASSSSSSIRGTITQPLGARAVPTFELTGEGAASIYEGGGQYFIETSSKLAIRPQAN